MMRAPLAVECQAQVDPTNNEEEAAHQRYEEQVSLLSNIGVR
jgi:hypothetical protein